MSDPAPKKTMKAAGQGTVFDVRRPGRAPMQTTSRPVIVGHKPVVRDPITTGKTELLPPKQKVDVQPLASPEVKANPTPEPEKKADSTVPPELATVATELGQASNSSPTPNAPQIAQNTDPKPVTDSVSSVMSQETAKKRLTLSPEVKRQMEEEVRNAPKESEPKGVVVSDDHGPINFMKVFLWCVSVILLVAVVGDLLLDAGTITTSVNIPHTHLIK